MVEAIAQYNFESSCEDELSFRKGQKLVVFRKAEENWFSAATPDGESSGLVPMNYVKVKECSFLQHVTRSGAESLLLNQANGAFVIRRSESEMNEKNFSLSVKYCDVVQHFKILTDQSHKFFLWVVKFSSLNELVEYYKTSSVSRTQNICLVDMKTPGAHVEFHVEAPTEYAKARFDFNGEEEGEITFHVGDEIEVSRKLDENWWEGRVRPKGGQRSGVKGLFPASYVQLMK